MQNLKNRNAVITGAARGIGEKIAHALAEKGMNIDLRGVFRGPGKIDKCIRGNRCSGEQCRPGDHVCLGGVCLGSTRRCYEH
jgi:NAD(P)-dependent dehydrogenase (short-subunit alcohol dehydrogenase family)